MSIKIIERKVTDNKMPFVNIKKQYLAMGLLIFVMLFLFNTRPVFQCQFNAEVSSYLPVIYGITPTYARLAQKADLTRYELFIVILLPLVYGYLTSFVWLKYLAISLGKPTIILIG